MSDRSWRIDVSNAPPTVLESDWPHVGDVYRKAGGRPGLWVIVAIQGEQAHALAFDMNGMCTGAQSYRASYFAENAARKVGVAMNLPDKIAVMWERAHD